MNYANDYVIRYSVSEPSKVGRRVRVSLARYLKRPPYDACARAMRAERLMLGVDHDADPSGRCRPTQAPCQGIACS